MPRARNIKHSFFTNDELAEENCPLGRLLFIGLWCHADYKGDLEWRSTRLKVQILPYDDCDIQSLAINLDKSGFVSFYSDGEKIYLHIHNFEKHQNPHQNEKKKGSEIPGFTEKLRQAIDLQTFTINPDKSRLKPDDSGSDPADSLSLNPDSRTLIPDTSGETKPDVPRATEDKFTEEDFELAEKIFDCVLAIAPKTKKPNLKRWADDIRLMRERDGHTLQEIMQVFLFANTHHFWWKNIQSPSKLREQFARLHSEMTNGDRYATGQSGTQPYKSASERADEAAIAALERAEAQSY